MKLNNRTVLVTGATAGIGRALTQGLLERGCRVIACGRDNSALTELARHSGVFSLRGDLRRMEDLESWVAGVTSEHPDLSVLINNAGVQHLTDFTAQPFDQLRDATFEETAVNFIAPILLSALLLPTLARQPSAAIVNVTSGLALSPKKSSSVYCATKAGMRSFTKALRYRVTDTAPHVRIIEALPPLVDTAMTRGRGRRKISPVQAANEILQGVERDHDEIYVGKSKLLKAIHRIAPAVAERILRNW